MPNKYDKTHDALVRKWRRRIKALYDEATLKACQAGENGLVDGDLSPLLKRQLDDIYTDLFTKVESVVANGVRSSWALANNKNNELVHRIFGNKVNQLTELQREKYFNNHDDALKAFLERRDDGMNLSKEVWDMKAGYQTFIEDGLKIGIAEGKDARAMARDVQGYLKEPEKLFRRVRGDDGELHLSKNAAAYHPGRGVYRSSYMNALRLTATETNIAYRTADHLRMMDNDSVVGFDIVLSNNHTCKGVKGVFIDICDELEGRYPKDFKFVGWHPFCRCHIEPVLKTDDELADDVMRILKGEEPTTASANEVTELPDNFKNWMQRNQKRIDDRVKDNKPLPYFVRDNKVITKRDMDRASAVSSAKEIGQRIAEATKPASPLAYVAVEPFSPIIMDALSKIKKQRRAQKILEDIVYKNPSFIEISSTPQGEFIKSHPLHKTGQGWHDTLQMAKDINRHGGNVVFLPEYEEVSCADAIVKINGKWKVVDFKHSTTTSWNTLQADLEKGFKQAPAVVVKLTDMNADAFIEAIEYMKRNNITIGDMKVINKYGMIADLSKEEFSKTAYAKKIRKLL